MLFSFFFFFFFNDDSVIRFLFKKNVPAKAFRKEEDKKYCRYEITDISNKNTIAVIYEIDSDKNTDINEVITANDKNKGEGVRIFLFKKLNITSGNNSGIGILIHELDGNDKFVLIDPNDFPTYEVLCDKSPILTTEKNHLNWHTLLNVSSIAISTPTLILIVCSLFSGGSDKKNKQCCCPDTINVNIVNKENLLHDIIKDEIKKEVEKQLDSNKTKVNNNNLKKQP